MSDFETHTRGTYDEIKASRALANEIEQVSIQYGQVVPEQVWRAYLELKKIYTKQLEGYYE